MIVILRRRVSIITLPLPLPPILSLALTRAPTRNRNRLIGRVRPVRRSLDQGGRSRPGTALSSLRMTAEADNCASALCLLWFAAASSPFSLRWPCFPPLARNTQLARCLRCNVSSQIQQKNGRRHQRRILTSLPPVLNRLNLHTNLVRQRRSHG